MLSWTSTQRLMTTYPRSWRRELLCEDGDSGTFQRNWRAICTAGLNSDKEMGNFWFWDLWLIAFWGAREVLGLWAGPLPAPPGLEFCKWKPVSSSINCSVIHQGITWTGPLLFVPLTQTFQRSLALEEKFCLDSILTPYCLGQLTWD